MSWIDRIQKGITITTGDGKVFNPLYVINSKNVEFNVAEFEFPHIGGTLVKRSEWKGTRFQLDIVFQGDDNIEVSNDFELSARDKRPWRISHPIYDNIIVQPISLAFDNSGLNTTKITIELVETIVEDAPKFSQDPKDKTNQDITTQQETSAESFSNDVVPNSSDLNTLSNNVDESYTTSIEVINDEAQANEFFNIYNSAQTAILKGSSDVSTMISSVQNVLFYPASFKVSVLTRLNLFKSQIAKLNSTINFLINPNQKKIYENNGGALIMGMISSSVNPLDASDYGNKTDVFFVINFILNEYNSFLGNLDVLQTENGGDVDSYIPDFNTLNQLTSVVSYAVSQLFTIAIGAKQERKFILESDSNVINLTHRFYGLDIADSMIDEFIRNNSIGINELFGIEKGREIIYYI